MKLLIVIFILTGTFNLFANESVKPFGTIHYYNHVPCRGWSSMVVNGRIVRSCASVGYSINVPDAHDIVNVINEMQTVYSDKLKDLTARIEQLEQALAKK